MPDLRRDITRATCSTYDANADAYGEISEDYGRFPGLRQEVAGFADRAPYGPPVLDLGCGGGRDTRLLAALGRRVIAGDYAAGMLTWARSRSAGSSGFLRLDALSLPLRDRCVAGVWASGSLLHLPLALMGGALAEAYRVLVPGGITVISMRDGEGEGWRNGGSLEGERWFTFVGPQTFTGYMEAAGFSDIRVRFSGRSGWYVALGER
ncbi:class I SAM-dependent methyltransferase [Nonomuraea sp. NPDC059007]|uniref:class I SAM-dependent methyltransferase n=1 Tax=Nonomuraea sp. NPDC059007 TaxID=3346692 RepID=UPI0036BB5379